MLGLQGVTHAAEPEVIIDPGGAPPEVLQEITRAVSAITRLAQDQDVREVSRLRRRAWDAARAALRTQGYFSPVVTLDASEGGPGGAEFWDISIQPGERSRVRLLGLQFAGAIAAPAYEGRRAELQDAWPLRPGMPFINNNWSAAKSALLDEVSRKEFYFARYARTRATIDPQAAAADLEVQVDSGPPVRMGPMRIEGLQRVPESLIARYVRYNPGDPYDQDLLDAWQQALQSTTFFRGAFVTLDESPVSGNPSEDAGAGAAGAAAATETAAGDAAAPEAAAGNAAATGARRPSGTEPVALPVHVRVTESAARRVSSSLGVDSDYGVRVEGLYRQNIVFGQPVWIETGAGIDPKRQRVFFDVHLPPNLDGYQDSFGTLYEHTDIEGQENSRTGLGWTRSQKRQAAGASRVEYETQLGALVTYDKTRVSGGGENYEVPSWSLSWKWLRRDVDAKYEPREGNLVEFGLGAGTTLDTWRPFYRSSLRAQRWWPMGRHDVVTIRGEVGKVWSETDRLPQDFSFRTGGSRSVRGYRYQSIGIPSGDAIIGAPALAVASVEYVHYFTDLLGASIFVDAGDAAPSFSSMDWHIGYGAGLAVRTPAGPFYVDLAWADKDRRLRLHFSLGIAF